MQINSIKPYCIAYNANAVSMNGRKYNTTDVANKVKKFLEENNIYFDGEVSITGNGTLYRQVALGSLNAPYFIRTKKGEEIELKFSDCTSFDEVAYKFAKVASGKTIYNTTASTLACIMTCMGIGTGGYKPVIQVPDFFGE